MENRQSDNGFYLNSSSTLCVFPITSGPTAFTGPNVFHHVVLTDASNGQVRGYLDGSLEFTASTGVMHITNAANLLHFFLVNVAADGQGEYSSGRVALIRLHDSVLTPDEVRSLGNNPFAAVPEPSSLTILSLSTLSLLGWGWRRARLRTVPVNRETTHPSGQRLTR